MQRATLVAARRVWRYSWHVKIATLFEHKVVPDLNFVAGRLGHIADLQAFCLDARAYLRRGVRTSPQRRARQLQYLKGAGRGLQYVHDINNL